MEKRRLQKIGGSSYSMTLPKRWVEKLRLKEGSEVKVSARASGALVVRPVLPEGEAIARSIDLTGLTSEQFRREIIAAYLYGATEVRVTAKCITKDRRKEARRVSSKLTGFEIVEETTDVILFRSLLEGGDFPFADSMRMSFKMVRSMFEDTIAALKKGDKELARDTAARDHDVDKSVYVVTRLSSSLSQSRISEERLGVDLDYAVYCARLARELERIADHAAKIAFMTYRGNFKFGRAHLKSFEELAGQLVPFIDERLFLTERPERAKLHKMIEGLCRSEENIEALLKRVTKSGSASGVLAVDSIDRLRGYLLNMAECALERCDG